MAGETGLAGGVHVHFGMVGQFEFVEWSSDNHLRHSRFIALRDKTRRRRV